MTRIRQVMTPLLAGAWLCAIPGAISAETAFVIDKLLVGVHADKSLDSPIIKVFSTGTQLEVLQRVGDLAQIKGPEGVTGWVDAVYLTTEQPAAEVLELLETQNRQLVEDLKAAQSKISETEARLAQAPTPDPQASEQIAAIRRDNEGLQQSLLAERARADSLQMRIDELEKGPASDRAALASMQSENAALKAELQQARPGPPPMQATVAVASPAQSREVVADRLRVGGRFLLAPATLVILGGAVLLACFACGAWFMDYLQRRRHGGFRL